MRQFEIGIIVLGALAAIIVFLMICRMLSTFLHEMGHGLAALLVTKGDVSVYIGSMEGVDVGRHYRLGRFHIYHRFSLMYREGGRCVPGHTDSITAKAFCILMGPLFSVVVGLFVVAAGLTRDWNGMVMSFCFLFLFSTLYDLWINLYPSPDPMILANGNLAYNDGMALLQLYRYSQYPLKLREALGKYDLNEHEAALNILGKAYTAGERHPEVLNTLSRLYLSMGKGADGLKLYEAETEHFEGQPEFLMYKAVFYAMVGSYNQALAILEESLEAKPESLEILANRGFVYNLMGRYPEAIEDFTRIITKSELDAYTYANRSFAYVKNGQMDLGKADLVRALELDPENSYAHLTQGVIHREEDDEAAARLAFEQARELNPYTYGLDEYLKA